MMLSDNELKHIAGCVLDGCAEDLLNHIHKYFDIAQVEKFQRDIYPFVSRVVDEAISTHVRDKLPAATDAEFATAFKMMKLSFGLDHFE